MQNRGTIATFTIVLILSALYILSFSYFSNKFEAKAIEYATTQVNELPNSDQLEEEERDVKIEQFKQSYLKEHGDEVAMPIVGKTYDEIKKTELNLGLDLQGGMAVTLEVSIPELLISLSDYSQEPAFEAAISEARKAQATSNDDFVTLFGEAYENQGSKVPLWKIFNNFEVQDKFTKNVSNAETIKELRTEAFDAIDNTEGIIRKRIDQFGVAQPNVQQESSTKRIIVELPGVKDKEGAKGKLVSTANLEFWDMYFPNEIIQTLAVAENTVSKAVHPEVYLNTNDDSDETTDEAGVDVETLEGDTTNTLTDLDQSLADQIDTSDVNLDALNDINATNDGEVDEDAAKKNPIFSRMLRLNSPSVIGYVKTVDTAVVNTYLNNKIFKESLPLDLVLMWGASSEDVRFEGIDLPSDKAVALYGIRKSPNSAKPVMDGSVITSAFAVMDPMTNRPEMNMDMNPKGSGLWSELTKKNSADNNRPVAITLDARVLSAPSTSDHIKTGGTRVTFGSATGQRALEDAKELAGLLKAGALPAPAKIVSEKSVGPSIGEKNINAGKWSFVIALAVILLYMIFYYNGAGVISNIALLVNMILLIGALISIGAALTLPGIAGIVLTIGMAVDANVLIYERIREELRQGKGLSAAVKDGYKAAYSAIIDANVTTMLTAIILFTFGSGAIKGFATTLIIGIITSLFSAIIITRLIIYRRLDKKKSVSFSSNMTKNWFININFDFVGKRKIFYVISGLLVTAGIIGLFTNKLELGTEFTGGRNYEVEFEGVVSHEEVSNAMKGVFVEEGSEGNARIQTIGTSGRGYKISTGFMVNDESLSADSLAQIALYTGLDKVGKPYDKDEISVEKVGGSISDEFRRDAYLATILSLLVIFFYIFLRFRKLQYSVGALLAMVHDVLIVLGIFALFRGLLPFSLQVDQAFIAAILTVIGYSINDTVVVFDRIREYIGLKKGKDKAEIINAALNSTLSRTINTSLSTFVVLLMIFIFGGDTIKGFTFALMVGVVVGTYSSLFIASPAVLDLDKKDRK